jgi:hypothetical protein
MNRDPLSLAFQPSTYKYLVAAAAGGVVLLAFGAVAPIPVVNVVDTVFLVAGIVAVLVVLVRTGWLRARRQQPPRPWSFSPSRRSPGAPR